MSSPLQRLVLAPLTLLLAPSLLGQTTTLVNNTELAIWSDFYGSQQWRTRPAGEATAPGQTTEIGLPNTTTVDQIVRTTVTHDVSGAYPVARVVELIRVENPGLFATNKGGTASSFGNPGPHSLLFTITDAPGRVARIHIDSTSFLNASSCNGSGAVDVGNDGSREFSHSYVYGGARPTNLVLPVVIPPSGTLPILIETYSYGHKTVATPLFRDVMGFDIDVGYERVPLKTCSWTNYGAGCGLQLAGSTAQVVNQYRHTVTLSGGTAFAPGILLLGLQQTRFPVTGVPCDLLVVPLLSFPVLADFQGQTILQFPLVSGFSSVLLNFQGAYVIGGGVALSPGLHLTCQ